MVKYTIKERVNPQAIMDSRKYYAFAQNQGMTSIRELARIISKESTVSMMDTMAVIEGLLQVIPDKLIEGRMVSLGDFGSFRVTISSKGANTLEDFNEKLIVGLNLKFRPGKEFRNKLNTVKFRKNSIIPFLYK
ncbi:MAG: HU family DNA-binding protein [Bacteroidota bacterium]